MRKRSFADINCPIAQTLELIGEWWTLLIIRNAFCGMCRFDDFQRHLDISSNILSARLQRLVASGILLRQPAPDDGRAVEYTLTDKGRALYPVLLALTQWGEAWAPHPDGARLQLYERASGQPVAGLAAITHDGRCLPLADIDLQPGPAADARTHQLASLRRLQALPSSEPATHDNKPASQGGPHSSSTTRGNPHAEDLATGLPTRGRRRH